jgi:mannose-6-phosphate isomerase-like protein (cupin superfamily)
MHPPKFLLVDSDALPPVPTSHPNGGLKRVIAALGQLPAPITQIATAVLQPGDASGTHAHASMDEYFFVLEGTGSAVIDGEEMPLGPGAFLMVRANTPHNIVAATRLSFFYFGLAAPS